MKKISNGGVRMISKVKKQMVNAKGFIKYNYIEIMLLVVSMMSLNATPVMASGGTGAADAKWNAVIDFILPWITRLGGVVVLIGAVEFGLAFKNDDAEGKTKGMRTVIAGCIVTAVGLSSSVFLS